LPKDQSKQPHHRRLIIVVAQFFPRHLVIAIADDARFGAAFYKAAMTSAQGLQLLMAGVCRGLEAVPSLARVNTT